MNHNSSIRDKGTTQSFIPDIIYSLTVAFPSWAGLLAVAYALGLSGLRPLHLLFRDLNH